ncbi:MAG: hypothetical protein LAP13_03430 [Acidobacteriia bacterium]|nr:hypothetical protein [Terriglobia bacterium]
MPRGRPIPKLTLTTEERKILQAWARWRKTTQALASRARIVLGRAEGKSNTAVAATLETAGGKVIGERHRRHRAVEFRRFLDMVDAATPAELGVHLILDNDEILEAVARSCSRPSDSGD